MSKRITIIATVVSFTLLSGSFSSAEIASAATGPAAVPAYLRLIDDCQECWGEAFYDPTDLTWKAYYIQDANNDGECPPMAADCVRCLGNPACEEVYHSDFGFADSAAAWGWVDSWYSTANCGDCNESFGGGLENLAFMQVHHAAALDLARTIALSDGALWINYERDAIQGVGCNGKGVAFHLPLSRDFTKAVVYALDSSADNFIQQQPD